MQTKKKRGSLSVFLKNDKVFPGEAAIAAGLYPLLFYYTNNYKMINSWDHLGYFVFLFLLLPLAVFFTAHFVSKIAAFKKVRAFVLPFLNFFFFFFYLNIALYAGFSWMRSAIVLIIAIVLTALLRKYFKKIIIFQLILAVIGVFTLTPVVI